MGLGFESLIGEVVSDQGIRLVTHDQLHMLMDIATQRFAENTKRIERFRNAFQQAFHELPTTSRRKGDGVEWEDAASRRERKRAEGLRRKAELGEKKDVKQSENDQVLHFSDTETH
jgi:tRNA wybutosine-synthesizing protein 3